MISSGRRREALAALDEMLTTTPDDAPLRERANGLRSRRVLAPLVTIESASERFTLVTGSEIVIGRTDGSIKIPSNAVSRQHLRIARDGDTVTVRDLESRNGTQLRGINLAGALAIGDGIELKLGKEVSLRIAPSQKLVGTIEIDIAGAKYFASLGPTKTPVQGIELAAGADGWLELIGSAYAGDVQLMPRATLLLGDALSIARGGVAAFRVVSIR